MSEQSVREIVFSGPNGVRSLAAQQAHSKALFSPSIANNELSKIQEVHSWTYAAMKARGNAVSSVPLRAYTGSKDKRVLLPDTHPLSMLCDRPNPSMSRSQFMRHWVRILDIKGIALAILDPMDPRDGAQFNASVIPTEIWPQDPDDYRVAIRQPDGLIKWSTVQDFCRESLDRSAIVSWRHQRFGFVFPPEQIIFHHAIEGAPLKAARIPAEGDYLAGRYTRSWIDNDCMPSGWYNYDRTMTDEEYRQFKERNKNENEGIENVGKPILLEGGLGFTANTATARDMQWIEGRKHWLDEICSVFGVPKSILSIGDEAKYANHLSTQRVFIEQTIFPIHNDFAEVLWVQLLYRVEGGNTWVEFDYSGVPAMQSDQVERMAMAAQAVTMGVPLNQAITTFKLGFDPVDGGNVGYIGLGVQPIQFADFSGDTETDTPDEGTDPVAAIQGPAEEPAADVQSTALNGAQIASLQSIVQSVADGFMPPESAVVMILVSFPTIDKATAESIISPAKKLAEQNDNDPASEDGTTEPSTETADAEDAGSTNNASDEEDDEGEDAADDSKDDEDRYLNGSAAATRPYRPRSRLFSGLASHRSKRAKQINKAQNAYAKFRRQYVKPLTTKFEKRFQKELIDQKREIMRQFDQLTQRSNVSMNTRADEFMSASDIAAIGLNRDKWDERFKTAFNSIYGDMLKATGEKNAALGDGLVFDAANPRWIKFINEHVADKLVGANDTTIDAVRKALRDSLFNGETGLQARERLRTLPEFTRARARTVAVTEMGYTVNETNRAQFEEFGFDDVIWITDGTGRSRESHIAAENDAPRKRGVPFSNGMRWPYDESGPAEEIINCSCELGVPLD